MDSPNPSTPPWYVLVLLLSLVTAWLLWSGLYKPLLLSLGVLSCVICFWLARRMEYFDDNLYALHFSLRLLRYWFWLGGQIIRSSLDVSRIVLDPRLPISPRIVEIEVESAHPFDHVMLGNSITLTPGTLSIDVYEGVIQVHALTEEGARELAAGEMNRRVTRVRST